MKRITLILVISFVLAAMDSTALSAGISICGACLAAKSLNVILKDNCLSSD